MLAEIDRYDALVFWKTDRLVRRRRDWNRVVDACEQARVRLVSVVDPIDTSSPILQGVAGLLASLGEQESQNISTRVKRAGADAATAGTAHGGRRAFGYTAKGSTIIETEAKLIREARDRFLAGESMTGIVKDWNARKIAPTIAPRWSVPSFREMLAGPKIAGLRRYQGETIGTAAWPAIIDHDAIVARLARNSRGGRPAHHLLTGLARCARCGGKMHSGVAGDGSRLWMCRKGPAVVDRCGRCNIRAVPVDELVEAAVVYRLSSRSLAKALRAPKRKRSRKGEDPDVLARELDELADLAGRGELPTREWLRVRKGLEERLGRARALAADADDRPSAAKTIADAPDVGKAWRKLDVDQKRKVLGELIDSITIRPNTPGNRQFDPDRIDIDWRV